MTDTLENGSPGVNIEFPPYGRIHEVSVTSGARTFFSPSKPGGARPVLHIPVTEADRDVRGSVARPGPFLYSRSVHEKIRLRIDRAD